MKKFIITRFGINNFSEKWFDWRFELFSILSFKSIENNKTDDLYWIIFTNSDIPIKYKRKLNFLISNSTISENVFLLDVDYPFMIADITKKFVNEHSEENEKVMLIRFDGDDSYRPGFIKEVEELAETKNEDNFLITCSLGYHTYLYDKVAIEWEKNFRSMNNFICTKDRNIEPYMRGHTVMGNVFKENGWAVFIDKSIKFGWSKNETPENLDKEYCKDAKYEKMLNSQNESKKIEISKFFDKFNLNFDELEAFYKKYKTLSFTQPLVYKNSLTEKANKLNNEMRVIKNIFIESMSEKKYDKPIFKRYIKDLQKKSKYTALEALEKFYGRKCRAKKELLLIKNLKDYMEYLENIKEEIIIVFSVADDASRQFKKFMEINKINLKVDLSDKYRNSYVSIIDSKNNHFYEEYSKDTINYRYNCTNSQDKYLEIDVISKGYIDKKNRGSSIVISNSKKQHERENRDEREYSINNRGMNIVIIENRNFDILDTINIDMYKDENLIINRYI